VTCLLARYVSDSIIESFCRNKSKYFRILQRIFINNEFLFRLYLFLCIITMAGKHPVSGFDENIFSMVFNSLFFSYHISTVKKELYLSYYSKSNRSHHTLTYTTYRFQIIDCHDIAEILLKVNLNTIKQTNKQTNNQYFIFISQLNWQNRIFLIGQSYWKCERIPRL